MSVTDLRALSALVERCLHPEDLFGLLGGSKPDQHLALKHVYLKLVEVIHPDKYSATADVEMARRAFVKATSLRDRADRKIDAGTYGDKTKTGEAEEPRVDPDPPPSEIANKKRTYKLGRRFAQGDLADLYECSYRDPVEIKAKTNGKKSTTVWSTLMEPDEDVPEPGVDQTATFKIVVSPADNDLLVRESEVLGKLYPADAKDEKYLRYLPRLIDSFEFRKGAVRRRVNVLPKFNEMYSMAEVLATYPNGLDYRDVVWMYKRLLVGLGYAHSQGVIHGGVIPTHILVHPVNHGARIIDWCYAVQDGKGHVPALSKPYRDYYAPEVLKKLTPTPATDIFMASKCAIAMMGGDPFSGRMPDAVPKPIQNFLTSCLIAAPTKRPDDAWKLHDDLAEILEKVVGKPRYRPLAMPPVAKA